MPSHPLEDLTVLDLEGKPVRLGELWAEKAVVLVFLRHYGWLFCKQQVAQLRGVVERVEKAGATLVAVGNGSAAQAKAFHRDQEMNFRLLTDPSLRTYKAAGFRSGLATTLTPGAGVRAIGALLGGHVQTRTKGAALQQGGALVIAKDGTELYRFVSREAGDHPDPEDLLRALGASPARRRS